MSKTITSAAILLVSIFCMAVLVGAQTPAIADEAAAFSLPSPELKYVGQETYDVNGQKAIRHKLSVSDRASYPNSLWRPLQLESCSYASEGTGTGAPPKEKLKGKAINNNVPRDQMAAFILRAMGEPNPPHPGSQRYADVPPSNPFYAFIDRVVALRIVQGCSRRNYCPVNQLLASKWRHLSSEP